MECALHDSRARDRTRTFNIQGDLDETQHHVRRFVLDRGSGRGWCAIDGRTDAIAVGLFRSVAGHGHGLPPEWGRCSGRGTGTSGASSTGAPGSSGSRGGGFVLTNAKMGSGSTSGSSGTSSSGTAGSATGSSSPSGMAAGMTRFKLEGSQSDLQEYANSQVEVTGKIDKGLASGSSATGSATTGATGQAGATGSGAAATGSAPGSRQDIPTLRVSSVRQVSPDLLRQRALTTTKEAFRGPFRRGRLRTLRLRATTDDDGDGGDRDSEQSSASHRILPSHGGCSPALECKGSDVSRIQWPPRTPIQAGPLRACF